MPLKQSNTAKIGEHVLDAELTIDNNHATITLSASNSQQLLVTLLYTGNLIFERMVELTPAQPYSETTVVTYTHALLRRMGHSGRAILYEPDVMLQVFDVTNGEKVLEIIPDNL